MGRAGAGSGHSSMSRSSVSHSSTRSSFSSHSVGSGLHASSSGHRASTGTTSRAGAGSRPVSGSNRAGFNSHSTTSSVHTEPHFESHHSEYASIPPRPPRRRHYFGGHRGNTIYQTNYYGDDRDYRGTTHTYSSSNNNSTILSIIIIVFVIIAIIGFVKFFDGHNNTGTQTYTSNSEIISTVERKKLKDVPEYDENCIIDELGWFDNTQYTASRIKEFYVTTGVQPYIVFKSYDSTLTTDEEKLAYAENYFDTNSLPNNAFLIMYFAEENIDDVGYCTTVCGEDAVKVMDNEAVGIFWKYYDEYWYSDLSTDDVFINILHDTSKKIM